MTPTKPQRPLSVMQRRWRRFHNLKRGWYSFVILFGLYGLSFLSPVLINSRALIVRFEGEYYFPIAGKHIEARHFGQRRIGEARYRDLQKQFEAEGAGNWVVLPPYPYDPIENLLKEPHLVGNPPHSPSRVHWLGTDDRGRDVFARLIYGFKNSMTFALGVVGFAYVVGMTIGACFGFFGGRIDIYGLRFVEIWQGMPFLYTVMIIGSIVRPSLLLLVVILAVFRWMGISFYMRGEFYREKSKDYVAAAIAQGDSRWAIMFRHILPNSLTPIITFAPFAFVNAIIVLVSLDFLGFGLPPPTPSWGELFRQGLDRITSGDWHLVLSPFIAMFVTLIMVVFVGEAIREAFDPKVFSRLR